MFVYIHIDICMYIWGCVDVQKEEMKDSVWDVCVCVCTCSLILVAG